MGKKRILIYTESFLPSIGGLENNTLLLCNSMVDLGYDVTLITPQINADKKQKFRVVESRSFFQFLKKVYQHHEIWVNGGVAFKIIIPCIILFRRYRIIYQMATLYNNIPEKMVKNRFWNFIRFILAKNAKTNIAVSEFSYQALKKKITLKKIALLTNPADPIFEDFIQKRGKDDLKLFECLLAGRLIEGKGVHLLINAIKELNLEGHQIHLHVIGDGPEKNYVQQQVDDVYLSYHLPMTKINLKIWLQKVHLTIIPSTTHIEGSPLIMAESLVSGTPVLVSSQPAMAYSIQHPQLVFESSNLIDLKKKILYLMDEHHYQKINAHCHQIAEDFSYHRYIKNLEAILIT